MPQKFSCSTARPTVAVLASILCIGASVAPTPEEIVARTIPSIKHFTLVNLDTASLARDVQAGRPVRLPFGLRGGQVVEKSVVLTLVSLRSPQLRTATLKDGDGRCGQRLPLPRPATYQGKVGSGSAAVTMTETVVEGSFLDVEGWSVIEPLEPLLRINNASAEDRRTVLRSFNHIVYNAEDTDDEIPDPEGGNPSCKQRVQPGISSVCVPDEEGSAQGSGGRGQLPSVAEVPRPLRLRIAGDSDVEFLAAYPMSSVMPFWLKQETMLNAVDWLYNCLEADANRWNTHANCANSFDGGHGAFQVRLEIEGFETWTSGGPDSPLTGTLLRQSIVQTHQSDPPCCGPPHTAGKAHLVHFFSGKSGVAGEAAGIGGLDEYGSSCTTSNGSEFLCHHALSQMVPGEKYPALSFRLQLLVAHEIGHNNGAPEDFLGTVQVCWANGTSCGPNLMNSMYFGGMSKLIYCKENAREAMAPLLEERLLRK